MPHPTLIAQISDLHIKRPGALAYGRVDTAAALTRCIKTLNQLSPRPDLVVISGDLADTPSPEEYDHLKALLAPLQIPFAAIPGNHDDRTLMRATFPQDATHFGPINLTRAVGGIDVLLIDSSVPGKPHGEIDGTTLEWLETVLGASLTRPALLFVHHPPIVTGIAHMDVQNLRNANLLEAILRRHARVRLVAAGHVHRATCTMFAGTAATICPAPNHAVVLDLEERLPPSFNIEPPAFAPPRLVSGRRLRQRGYTLGADRRFRRAASVFRRRWESALATICGPRQAKQMLASIGALSAEPDWTNNIRNGYGGVFAQRARPGLHISITCHSAVPRNVRLTCGCTSVARGLNAARRKITRLRDKSSFTGIKPR